jgi:hypothetical protein
MKQRVIAGIVILLLFGPQRGEASFDLQRVPAKWQSVPSQSKEYWLRRIALVHPGMSREKVDRILRPRSEPIDIGALHGKAHDSVPALDPHWSVKSPYDFSGHIRNNPHLNQHLYANRVVDRVILTISS